MGNFEQPSKPASETQEKETAQQIFEREERKLQRNLAALDAKLASASPEEQKTIKDKVIQFMDLRRGATVVLAMGFSVPISLHFIEQGTMSSGEAGTALLFVAAYGMFQREIDKKVRKMLGIDSPQSK